MKERLGSSGAGFFKKGSNCGVGFGSEDAAGGGLLSIQIPLALCLALSGGDKFVRNRNLVFSVVQGAVFLRVVRFRVFEVLLCRREMGFMGSLGLKGADDRDGPGGELSRKKSLTATARDR